MRSLGGSMTRGRQLGNRKLGNRKPVAGTTGFLEFVNAADGGEGFNTWSNPENAKSDDGSYASQSFYFGETNTLQVTQLSEASIPAGATITGVTIRVKKYDTLGDPSDATAVLIVGGSLQAEDVAKAGQWPSTPTDLDYSFSTLPTRAQILASNFGFAIAAEGLSSPDSYIDSILCKVDYEA